MKRKSTSVLALAAVVCAVFVLQGARVAQSHCQLPCGIYDDEARFTMMEEHITTIKKLMYEIKGLSADPEVNSNELTRWVIAKDKHADDLAHIISYYFLAQRIKAPTKDSELPRKSYLEKLELLHQITVAAMKCKQTTDLKHVKSLENSVDKFHEAYFSR